jgi:hypothetical protein
LVPETSDKFIRDKYRQLVIQKYADEQMLMARYLDGHYIDEELRM